MEVLKKLVNSRRFWLAVLAFGIQALAVAFPAFPAQLVTQFQTLAVILIGVFTIDDTVAALKG